MFSITEELYFLLSLCLQVFMTMWASGVARHGTEMTHKPKQVQVCTSR
jgi:hypothetical protein